MSALHVLKLQPARKRPAGVPLTRPLALILLALAIADQSDHLASLQKPIMSDAVEHTLNERHH